MATLRRSDAHKRQLMKLLREEGRPTYARLLNYFYVFITDDPDVIAYMRADKAIIVLNKNLALNQVSTIVRHEIMHEYLTHFMRKEKLLQANPEYRSSKGLDTDTPLDDDHELFNIAADYEISNRMYTDQDKYVSRGIYMGKDENNRERILRGLVTEDDFPGWENMTFEEMYIELQKMRKQDQQNGQSQTQKGQNGSEGEDDSQGGDNSEGGDDSQGGDEPSPSSSQRNNQSSSSKGSSKIDKLIQRAKQLNKQDSDEDIAQAIEELEDAKDVRDKMNKELENEFETEGEKEQRDEVNSVISNATAEIRKFLADPANWERMEREDKRVKQKEKIQAAERASESKRLNPLNKFKLNLQQFIADQIREVEERSFRRLNPAYEDSDFFVPSEIDIDVEDIPVVNVYHDVSGSFSDEAKTAAAMQAVDTLQTYVDKGELFVNKYYFADRVASTRAAAGGGTSGEAVLRHIQETRPTNVIIITDNGVYDCVTSVKVPGAVWILFYDGPSPNLTDHIKGQKQTRTYDVFYK